MYRQTLGQHLMAVAMTSKDAHRKRFLMLFAAIYTHRKSIKSRGITAENRLKKRMAEYMADMKFPENRRLHQPEQFFAVTYSVGKHLSSVPKVVHIRKPTKRLCAWQVRRNIQEMYND